VGQAEEHYTKSRHGDGDGNDEGKHDGRRGEDREPEYELDRQHKEIPGESVMVGGYRRVPGGNRFNPSL
jgi:hypothetical protein